MKIKFWYIVAAILIVSAVLIILLQNDSSVNISSSDIKIEHPEKIKGISITKISGTLEIDHINYKWFSKNKQELNHKLIINTLSVFNDVEILGMAGSDIKDSLFKYEKYFGTTLRIIYENKETEYKLVNVAGNNYLKISGSDKVYRIIYKNARDLNFEELFQTNITYWSENILLDISPASIKQIMMIYPEDETLSFILQTDNNKFSLYNYRNEPLTDNLDSEFILSYLTFFSDIKSIRISDSNLEEGPQFFSLLLIEHSGQRIHMNGYKLINKETGVTDPDVFRIQDNTGRYYNMYYADFDPILAELNNFIKN